MITNPKRVEYLLSQLSFIAEVMAGNSSHHLRLKNGDKIGDNFMDISVIIQQLHDEGFVSPDVGALDNKLIAFEKRTPKKLRKK